MNKTPQKTGFFAAAAMALTCAALGGCVNWSGDVNRYREVLDGPDASIARIEHDPAAELTLVEALTIANADNESIASSGEDYIQALAEKMRQAGTFLPTLTLGPSYSLNNSDGIGTSDSNSITANASANGSLSDLSNIKSAGLSAQQRAQLLLDTRQSVLLSVATAYYDVLRFEQQIEVLDSSIKTQEERVRDQQARVDIGGGRPLDLAQSKADLAGTRAQLTQARANAANARSALARLMGVDAVHGSLTDQFSLPDDVPASDAWMNQALEQRQDLMAANYQLESSRANLEAAIREYLPTVSINFNYFLHTDPSSPVNWTAGISASVPIFSAMSIEADIRRAWSAYRQAGLTQSQTRRIIVDDVRQGCQNFDASRSRLIDLQTQVEAAQEAFDLSQRAYELGSQSNLDRLTQEDTLRNARLDLVDEQYNEKTAYLNLLRVAGQLDGVLPVSTGDPEGI